MDGNERRGVPKIATDYGVSLLELGPEKSESITEGSANVYGSYMSGVVAAIPLKRSTRPSILSISARTTFEKSSRKSTSVYRSGSNSANVLMATKGFLISCAMPDARAPNEERRSALRFSRSRFFSRVRSLKTISAPRTVPSRCRSVAVEQTTGTVVHSLDVLEFRIVAWGCEYRLSLEGESLEREGDVDRIPFERSER